MLYRLDYIDTNGKTTGPVQGWHVGLATGRTDVLTRHAQTARTHATNAARRAEVPVLVTRIGKAGAMKPSFIVHPDGSSTRPPGTRAADPREDCKRSTGQRCFCTACRAERRRA